MRRFSTGLSELDLVLGGGLPVGALVILAGSPGTGKTVLAEQICFANATREHKAIYYSTVSESPAKLVEHLETFDFYDRSALADRIEFINLGEMLQGDPRDSLGPLMDEMVRKINAEMPILVVLDSSKALRDLAGDARFAPPSTTWRPGSRTPAARCSSSVSTATTRSHRGRSSRSPTGSWSWPTSRANRTTRAG